MSELDNKPTEATKIQGNIEYKDPQYTIKYDMKNKTDKTVASTTSVTVLTHGYNSTGKDWLNNSKDWSFNYEYSSDSLVDKMVKLYGVEKCVLLFAKMTSFNTFDLTRYSLTPNSDGSVKGEKQGSLFRFSKDVYGKHFIVVFESYPKGGKSSNDSNANLYYQFNYMLSNVLYDLKQIDPAKRIPKVNLIGHSRGGLTNLQYALDHPDIVENLISIGTPYLGSTSAAIVKYDEYYGGDGLNDIINPKIYNDYLERWNSNYDNLYSKINAMAIGACSTLPFLGAIAHNDRSEMFNTWSALGVDVAVAAVSAYKYASWFIKFFEKIAVKAVTNAVHNIFPTSIAASAAEILINEIEVMFPYVVWLSDAIVPLGSQLGDNFFQTYKGFKRREKLFSLLYNYDFSRVAQKGPPVVHNLEPWDSEIIEMVIGELRESKNVEDNSTVFKYYETGDDEICITGVRRVSDKTVLEIPETINVGGSEKVVTEIAADAFKNNISIKKQSKKNGFTFLYDDDGILSNVETVILPSSIKKVGDGAFKGLNTLKKVSFVNNSNDVAFGNGVFESCTNLETVEMPTGTTAISAGMFKNCKALSNMKITNSVKNIGAEAFLGCESYEVWVLPYNISEIGEFAFFGCKGKSSIYLPINIQSIGDGAFAGISDVQGFSISSQNNSYYTTNGILYNKEYDKLVQYPKAKSDSSFKISENVKTIGTYAFYGCENLVSADISGVETIENSAFEKATNLETIIASGLKDVSYKVFTGTKWLETAMNNDSQAILDGILIVYAVENKKIIEYDDWDKSIVGVAGQAFALSDVETMHIPSRVCKWNNYAFANAVKLKNVYVDKMQEKLVEDLFSGNVEVFGGNAIGCSVYLDKKDVTRFNEHDGKHAFTGLNVYDFMENVNIAYYDDGNAMSNLELLFASGTRIDEISYYLRESLYPALTRLNGDGTKYVFNGDFVASVSSDDYTNVAITLKDEIQSNSGDYITAENYKAYYDFVMSQSETAPYYWSFVKSVTAEDNTLTIEFIASCDHAYILHEMRALPNELAKRIDGMTISEANAYVCGEFVSYGKYVIKAVRYEDRIELIPNDKYIMYSSVTPDVNILFYNNIVNIENEYFCGEVDACYNLYASEVSDFAPEEQVYLYDDRVRMYLGICKGSSLVSQYEEYCLKQILYAFGLLIDYEEINARLGAKQEENEFFPDDYVNKGQGGNNGGLSDDDPLANVNYLSDIYDRQRKALQIFNEIGIDLTELKLRISIKSRSIYREIAEVICESFSEVGIELTIDDSAVDNESNYCDLQFVFYDFEGKELAYESIAENSELKFVFAPTDDREAELNVLCIKLTEDLTDEEREEVLQQIQAIMSYYVVKMNVFDRCYIASDDFIHFIGGTIKNLIY